MKAGKDEEELKRIQAHKFDWFSERKESSTKGKYPSNKQPKKKKRK